MGATILPPTSVQNRTSVQDIKKMNNDESKRVRRFCFTINNYTDDTTPVFDDKKIAYLIFGKEVAPTTGTPHLQGYIELKNPHTIKGLHKYLKGFSTASFRIANGTSSQNITYCSKSDEHPVEYGTPGPGAGARTDLIEATELIVQQPNSKGLLSVAKDHPSTYVKYYKGFEALADRLAPDPLPIPVVFREWQSELSDFLSREPHPRVIRFYVDIQGNSGKSFFIRQWASMYPHDTLQLIRGAQKQMFYQYDGHKYIFFDFTRSDDPDHPQLPYQAIETMKNGFRPTSMYGKRTRNFEIPHVVVMMNESPDRTKLSPDRYEIIRLT